MTLRGTTLQTQRNVEMQYVFGDGPEVQNSCNMDAEWGRKAKRQEPDSKETCISYKTFCRW